MADFMQSLGFNQVDPNNPFQQQTPGLSELIARLAATLAPASHFIGGTRTPLGRALGAGSLIAGAGAGTIADQLEAQRKDPLAQQLRLAQYIQQAGTAPTPGVAIPAPTAFTLPSAPNAADMTYSAVQPGKPTGFPAVAGPKGPAKFSLENLPDSLQMVALKAFPKLDPSEAIRDEYLKRQTNAPIAKPLGTALYDPTGTREIAPAQLTEAAQEKARLDNLYKGYAADVRDVMAKNPQMDRMQAANTVLEDPNKDYGQLPESYGLVKAAREYQQLQASETSMTKRQQFQEQQQNARNAFSEGQANIRHQRELDERAQPGLFADRETGLIGSITRREYVEDKKAGGTKYKPVSASQSDTVSLLQTADPMIKAMEKLAPVVLANNKGKQFSTLVSNAFSHKTGTDPALQQFLSIGAGLSAEQARALSGSSRVLGGMFAVIRGESVPDYKVTTDVAMRELSTLRTEMNNRMRSITGQKMEQFDTGLPKAGAGPTLPSAPGPGNKYSTMSDEDFLKAKPR